MAERGAEEVLASESAEVVAPQIGDLVAPAVVPLLLLHDAGTTSIAPAADFALAR